jgi:hypothetical protein
LRDDIDKARRLHDLDERIWIAERNGLQHKAQQLRIYQTMIQREAADNECDKERISAAQSRTRR